MGTSTHNGEQKGGTPLVPSWLEQPDVNPQNENGLGPMVVKFHQWVMRIALEHHEESSRGI